MNGAGEQGEMVLRELLVLCVRGRRDEALALLNQHQPQPQHQVGHGKGGGGGLLEQPWEGESLWVEGKRVYTRDRALHAASKGGSAELVLALQSSRKELLRNKIFVHPGLWLVASFL